MNEEHGIHIERLAERIESLDRYYAAQIISLRELIDSKREGDQLAVEKALTSARELAEKHNDLIRQQERKDETYATKSELGRLETWQNKIAGGLVVVAVVGVTNLVKLWTA